MTETESDLPSLVSADTTCITCGYNLRGLASDGRCPECGSGVAQSLRGDLLKFADPGWLARLRFGVSLKLWNIGLGIIAGIAAGVLVMIVGVPRAVITLAGIAGGVLGLWAAIAITTQEPRISLQEDPVTLRKIIRACAALAFLGSLLQNVGQITSISSLVSFVGTVIALCGYVAMFGELVYLRRLAQRIPDLPLALSTKRLMWLVGVGALIGIPTTIWFAVAMMPAVSAAAAAPAGPAGGPPLPPAPPGAVMVVGMGVFGVAVLVAFLWYIRLLIKYKNAFQHAAMEARAATVTT